ncbi:MAG: hypothetical protein WAP08_03460 [Smithellaceae bacterium]|nr:hypothetical protein [Syntrophaceae bacterium]
MGSYLFQAGMEKNLVRWRTHFQDKYVLTDSNVLWFRLAAGRQNNRDTRMQEIQSIIQKIRKLSEGEKRFDHIDLTWDEQMQREAPKKYLEASIELFHALGGKTIVEIGCMRQPMNHPISEVHPECCNDGHSTIYWCLSGARVYSADISLGVVLFAKKCLREYRNGKIVWCDGLKFLRKFKGRIDLLFLDAWDVLPGTKYAENHLLAYLTAKDNLGERNIVVIDDTDIGGGGKGKLLLPVLEADGYDILVSGRQSIALKL